ncbi:MAG: enoyl-CoA hydratase/isomerase family protein [Rudaea sp.]
MLETHRHESIVELRLSRPPVNALDAALVHQLRTAIESAPALGARGIVLSGKSGMFSAGLDVPALLQLGRKELVDFFVDFFGLCGALATSPIPIVAAITGHSPAGGAVLAIFCDYRVMARAVDPAKPFRIGLNEVQVGLTVPVIIQSGLQRLVGTYRAERLMVSGTMADSEQAMAMGLVDELADVDQVVPRSIEWLRELMKLPPLAMLGTRQIARRDLAKLFESSDAFELDEFAESWFGSETQAALKALVAKLKK